MPKMIGAIGNDCLVATVTMVCMYWRITKPSLSWRIPTDLECKEWTDFYQKGKNYVRLSGIPFNNIKLFLKSLHLPLIAELVFLEDSFGLRNLINANIPPIVLYDHAYMLKNIHGPGHAVILVDQTEEMFISVNPSVEPKFIYKLPKPDFEDSWKLKDNATIIIHPNTYRIEQTKVSSKHNSRQQLPENILDYIEQKRGTS